MSGCSTNRVGALLRCRAVTGKPQQKTVWKYQHIAGTQPDTQPEPHSTQHTARAAADESEVGRRSLWCDGRTGKPSQADERYCA